MLGDTGVAVSPDDPRYASLVGADVELPLTGRTIPIIADDFVDPDFGTGMVKVTPAHDPNDFDMAQRAGLPMLDVMTPEATMNDNAPEAFQGLDRVAARKAVLSALEKLGLAAGDDPNVHSVPHCYRCHTVVEPRLSLEWFVRMKPLAEPALEASRDGTITFTPPPNDPHRVSPPELRRTLRRCLVGVGGYGCGVGGGGGEGGGGRNGHGEGVRG